MPGRGERTGRVDGGRTNTRHRGRTSQEDGREREGTGQEHAALRLVAARGRTAAAQRKSSRAKTAAAWCGMGAKSPCAPFPSAGSGARRTMVRAYQQTRELPRELCQDEVERAKLQAKAKIYRNPKDSLDGPAGSAGGSATTGPGASMCAGGLSRDALWPTSPDGALQPPCRFVPLSPSVPPLRRNRASEHCLLIASR
jgi:hypothetical protein